jgi:hypothetical protein
MCHGTEGWFLQTPVPICHAAGEKRNIIFAARSYGPARRPLDSGSRGKSLTFYVIDV